MTEIKVFKHERFGEIRAMTDEKGEPWFVGRDVAEKLGYSDTQKVTKQRDINGKGMAIMKATICSPSQLLYIMYSYMLRWKDLTKCFYRQSISSIQ